jgi:hypothetical protein
MIILSIDLVTTDEQSSLCVDYQRGSTNDNQHHALSSFGASIPCCRNGFVSCLLPILLRVGDHVPLVSLFTQKGLGESNPRRVALERRRRADERQRSQQRPQWQRRPQRQPFSQGSVRRRTTYARPTRTVVPRVAIPLALRYRARGLPPVPSVERVNL